MSMSHHSAEEQAAQTRLLDELLGKAREHHSDGRLNSKDQGDAAIAIGHDPVNQVVVIQFAKPMMWVGMNIDQAVNIRDMLDHHINALKSHRK